jgi:hypothetical protein
LPDFARLLRGEDGVMIYNDCYSIFAGARHPNLLGQKALRGGWPEVAESTPTFSRRLGRQHAPLQGSRTLPSERSNYSAPGPCVRQKSVLPAVRCEEGTIVPPGRYSFVSRARAGADLASIRRFAFPSVAKKRAMADDRGGRIPRCDWRLGVTRRDSESFREGVEQSCRRGDVGSAKQTEGLYVRVLFLGKARGLPRLRIL